jgi:hypothetical protein
MEWVLGISIIAVLFVFWLLKGEKSSLENEKIVEAHHAGEEVKTIAAEERRDNFEKSLDENWPVREQSSGRRYREYLMMSFDQASLRIANVKFHPEVQVHKEHLVPVQTLVSVELQQSSETIMRLESVTTTKKSSPLLRAAVGGIAFGGAGAVVGAVSAKQTSTGTTTGKSETRKGPIYLVIGTTDLHTPMIKYKMPNMDVAEQWLHRIRGAIAVCSRRREDDDI